VIFPENSNQVCLSLGGVDTVAGRSSGKENPVSALGHSSLQQQGAHKLDDARDQWVRPYPVL
jgi:hypothetical protein